MGLVGGLMALGYGQFSYAVGSFFNFVEDGEGTGLQVVSVGLPLLALLGAGFVLAKPLVGGALMALSVLGILAFFGFGTFQLFTVVLLGVAAFLAFAEWKSGTKPVS